MKKALAVPGLFRHTGSIPMIWRRRRADRGRSPFLQIWLTPAGRHPCRPGHSSRWGSSPGTAGGSLGIVERRHLADFRSDLAVALGAQLLLESRAAGVDGSLLRLVEPVDHRAVLGAGVVALAHALGRVVGFPEHLEQRLDAGFARVVRHQHHFAVAGQAGTDFVVGRVRREAAGITHRGYPDARLLPEAPLGAPEAAQADNDLLHAGGEGCSQRVAIDVMRFGHRHRALASRQGLGGAGQFQFVGKYLRAQGHGIRLLSNRGGNRLGYSPKITAFVLLCGRFETARANGCGHAAPESFNAGGRGSAAGWRRGRGWGWACRTGSPGRCRSGCAAGRPAGRRSRRLRQPPAA